MPHLIYLRNTEGKVNNAPIQVMDANFGIKENEIYLIRPRNFLQFENKFTEVYPFKLEEVDTNGNGTFVQLKSLEPGRNSFYFNEKAESPTLETNEYYDFSNIQRVIHHTRYYSVKFVNEGDSTRIILLDAGSALIDG